MTGSPGRLSDVPVTALDPGRLGQVLSAEGLERFERTIARGRELLGESTLWTVNSTASGGGVAEMLRSLVGYVRGAGLDARWVVMGGDADFFAVTKRLHNHLHGAGGDGGLGAPERAIYERHTVGRRSGAARAGSDAATWCCCTTRRPRAWSRRWRMRACR